LDGPEVQSIGDVKRSSSLVRRVSVAWMCGWRMHSRRSKPVSHSCGIWVRLSSSAASQQQDEH